MCVPDFWYEHTIFRMSIPFLDHYNSTNCPPPTSGSEWKKVIYLNIIFAGLAQYKYYSDLNFSLTAKFKQLLLGTHNTYFTL